MAESSINAMKVVACVYRSTQSHMCAYCGVGKYLWGGVRGQKKFVHLMGKAGKRTESIGE